MLSIKNLEKYTNQFQTSIDNIVREYCQHLFLSYLYQEPNSEKLLFKGGTALRIVFESPRFSEDLDFSAYNIKHPEIEKIITSTLSNIEKSGIIVDIEESKKTSGGYLAIIIFKIEKHITKIQIEISLRKNKNIPGTRSIIQNNFIPAYTLVQLPTEHLINEKIQALLDRQKPRDFFDYYFLLSGNYALAKDGINLQAVLAVLEKSELDFRYELRRFLPVSQARHMKDFKKILIDKINNYIGNN
jgi:predicted nucleotidyltransferase component of viral defense system